MLGQFVQPSYCAQLMAQINRKHPWIEFDPDVFNQNYNKQPFIFHHRLAEHPQFSLDSLFALCRRLPSRQVRCRSAVIPDDAEFDSSLDRYCSGLTVDETIEQLREDQAYIAVYNAERDHEYKMAIEELLGEIATQTEPLEPGLNWYSTYIFISARGAVTPYHMDREMNFLFQIRGTKTVRLWDPLDEEVLTSAERDAILSFPYRPRPPYDTKIESKATVFSLRPGLGVHHPFIAPHLVHTGPEISISLAITFRTRQSDRWRDAHCMNQHLRQLGLRPRPIRYSAARDNIKAGTIRAARKIKFFFVRQRGEG